MTSWEMLPCGVRVGTKPLDVLESGSVNMIESSGNAESECRVKRGETAGEEVEDSSVSNGGWIEGQRSASYMRLTWSAPESRDMR